MKLNKKKRKKMITKWNLKTTKHFLCLLFFTTVFTKCYTQSSTKLTVGISIAPILTGSFNTSSSNAITGDLGQTCSTYTDSISAKETYRISYGASAWLLYAINKNIGIETGLTYIDVGYQRQLKNLNYQDKTYPGIGSGIGNGIVIDKSNTPTKNIDLNYRYQYLQIPILFNFDIKHSRDLKFEYYLNAGIGLNFLLNHTLQAKTIDSYSIDGKKEFVIDSTGFSPRRFAINAIIGGLVKYKYEKNIYLFAHPIIGFYPISVSGENISSYPYYVSINVGLMYSFKK